jgi:hypothetical protein
VLTLPLLFRLLLLLFLPPSVPLLLPSGDGGEKDDEVDFELADVCPVHVLAVVRDMAVLSSWWW